MKTPSSSSGSNGCTPPPAGLMAATREARLERRRRIASGMASLRARDPERFGELLAQYQQDERRLARFGLSEVGLARSLPRAEVLRFTLREALFAVVLVPLAIAGAAVFAIPYLVVDLLARRFTPSLEEGSTYKAGAGVLVYTIWIGMLAAWLSWDRRVWMGAAAAVALAALGLAALFALERELHVLRIVRSYFANLSADPVVGTRLVAAAPRDRGPDGRDVEVDQRMTVRRVRHIGRSRRR